MTQNLNTKSQPKEHQNRNKFLAFMLEEYPLIASQMIDYLNEIEFHWEDAQQLNKCCASIIKIMKIFLSFEDEAEIQTTAGVSATDRFVLEKKQLEEAIHAFFTRELIIQSITNDEKVWILKGMLLTRATDNRMKKMFLSGELKYKEQSFQGKGFRSLGQEAIFAAALRLKRGQNYLNKEDKWEGDVIAPLIRDLGIALAFHPDPSLALGGQAGKAHSSLKGKDLHFGDLKSGILPAAAPLTIATCTATGVAFAMQIKNEERIAVSFIGEGGSSLGEWHEAINFAASKKLPMIFCVENNQTALSTPVEQQSQCRVFSDKAIGYGMPSVTIDGNDPEEIAAAFTWAAEHARLGKGAVFIELQTMRMCGHAHHDDMLYLGEDPQLSFDLPKIQSGYAHQDKYEFWRHKDPLKNYSEKLIRAAIITEDEYKEMQSEVLLTCEQSMQAIKDQPWPVPQNAKEGVFADDRSQQRKLSKQSGQAIPSLFSNALVNQSNVHSSLPSYDKSGSSYLHAIGLALENILENDPNAFLLGEDIAAPYGNAFLLMKNLLEKHADRLHNSPIAEGAILGAIAGASLEGLKPIGEMQFNDFVASGFNELVNNIAKFHFRTGTAMPIVLRMPWGGLRRAGPYHSQDTSPWFYRTAGLKIVAPSTPQDAYGLLLSAVKDPDPVLFFEHIALYRNTSIKQNIDLTMEAIPLGKAALHHHGEDLTIISYGAYVHKAVIIANILQKEDDISTDVIDLRSLAPIDWQTIETSVRKTSKVLLIGEDSKNGSILESISSQIHESLFIELDGPCRVLGALDTPVPYSPSLEDTYLLSQAEILDTARAMLNW